MTIPSSGPVTFTDIQTEFGGTNPIALNEYYAGGGLVPAGTTGTYGPVPSSGQISVQNFYGTTAFTPVYIEEVFQTWLYTGTGSAQTITNNIDLSTKGGLVWIKDRTQTWDNLLVDSARGNGNALFSNTTSASTAGYGVDLASNGFTLTSGDNISNKVRPYVSWSWAKAPKFFDVVTYTGNDANRTISHNLGSEPGCIIIKRTDFADNWVVYHRALGNDYELFLNLTYAKNYTNDFNFTSPTSTTFAVNGNPAVNASGGTYVAYLFAHDAGGFGLTGTDNVISCGSYTGNGSTTGPVITLGYEPQWLLYKRTNVDDSWILVDNMRGFPVTGNTAYLNPNNSFAESNFPLVSPLATGFQPRTADSTTNASGGTYVYIAIRRGPMKVPTSGTSVFKPFYASYSEGAAITTDFPLDLSMWKANITYNWSWQDRLRGWPTASGSGGPALASNTTGVETTAYQNVGSAKFDSNTGAVVSYQADSGRSNEAAYFMFRRAPSFFDEVCYTGTGSTTTITHNLGVAPELVITKSRSQALGWVVWTTSLTSTNYWIRLDDTMAQTNSPTGYGGTFSASNYTIANAGPYNALNNAGSTYVAYLFATCAGVSKVGSYTGNGSTQTINCGFTGGSRFVMIKQTSGSGGDWIVFSTAMGIVAGTDRTALFNSGNATTTFGDTLDANNVGFELGPNSALFSINTSSETYIFLAIA